MLFADQLRQFERIVGLLLCSEDECLAVVVGHADVLQGRIERDGGDAENARRIGLHGIGEDIGRMTVQVVADALVA